MPIKFPPTFAVTDGTNLDESFPLRMMDDADLYRVIRRLESLGYNVVHVTLADTEGSTGLLATDCGNVYSQYGRIHTYCTHKVISFEEFDQCFS